MRAVFLCLALLALLAFASALSSSSVAASTVHEEQLESEVEQLEIGLAEVEAEMENEAEAESEAEFDAESDDALLEVEAAPAFPKANTAGTDKCIGDACAGALAQSAPSLSGEHNGPIDSTLSPATVDGPLRPGLEGDHVGSAGGVNGPWIPSDSGLNMAGEQKGEGAPFAAPPKRPEDIEDCVACRYIWLQVEEAVGNSAMEETVFDAFSKNCKDAAAAPMFFPACSDMFAQADDMIGDYMDGYTVNQVCENARLCR